jgi:hypothetical protein
MQCNKKRRHTLNRAALANRNEQAPRRREFLAHRFVELEREAGVQLRHSLQRRGGEAPHFRRYSRLRAQNVLSKNAQPYQIPWIGEVDDLPATVRKGLVNSDDAFLDPENVLTRVTFTEHMLLCRQAAKGSVSHALVERAVGGCGERTRDVDGRFLMYRKHSSSPSLICDDLKQD